MPAEKCKKQTEKVKVLHMSHPKGAKRGFYELYRVSPKNGIWISDIQVKFFFSLSSHSDPV